MANEFAGSALYAQWIWSGGTVQIDTDFRNWSYNDQGEEIDTTAGADSSRSQISSFDTGQVTASFLLLSNYGHRHVCGLQARHFRHADLWRGWNRNRRTEDDPAGSRRKRYPHQSVQRSRRDGCHLDAEQRPH